MDKYVAAIEIASKQLKIVIGYKLGNKVYVTYALKIPFSEVLDINDSKAIFEISEILSRIKKIEDSKNDFSLNITSVLLALPPFGFQSYRYDCFVNINNDDRIISQDDVDNLYREALSNEMPNNNVTVDIIPIFYCINNNNNSEYFEKPPLGKTAKKLFGYFYIHALPSNLINSLFSVFKNSGIKILKNIVSPFATINLLSSYENNPLNYFLLDIGSTKTTLSLVAKGKILVKSSFFNWGGDNITERIIENLNIKESDAEHYKILYGLTTNTHKFKTHFCETDDGYGNKIKHYPEELTKIIKTELDILVKNLLVAFDEMAINNREVLKFPLILIGGGSRLKGISNYLLHKVPNETVKAILPTSFGARDASLFNCLGLIYSYNLFPTYTINSLQKKVYNLTRENQKEIDNEKL